MRAFWFIVAFSMVLALSSCSDDTPTEEESGTGEGEVGHSGGVITSADGVVRLEVAVGALDETLTVRIEPTDQAPEGALTQAYSMTPEGQGFAVPGHVSFRFSPDGFAGVSTSDLRVAKAVNGAWEPLPGPIVDRELSEVSGQIGGLQSVALIAAGCQEDQECEAPRLCEAGTCRLVTCAEDAPCEEGQRCVESLCVALDPCADDGECGVGEYCPHGYCLPLVSCEEEAICQDGERCVDGLCVAECAGDDECPLGMRCNQGVCEASACVESGDCDPDLFCVEGACVPGECSATLPCPAGSHCLEGSCVVSTSCAEDADCSGGRVCVEGSCQNM